MPFSDPLFFLCAFVSLSYAFLVSGGNTPHSRCAIAKFAKRQHRPVFSPHFSHFSATLPRSRRFFASKIRNAAPTSLLPAVHCGGNFRNRINFNAVCNLK
jgi:hypothetical protein